MAIVAELVNALGCGPSRMKVLCTFESCRSPQLFWLLIVVLYSCIMPYKNAKVQKIYQKKWHRVNWFRIKTRMLKCTRQNKANVLAWFQTYKRTLKCLYCPERHPACLDFHHRTPRFKRFTISVAVASGICIKSLLKEIKKCDIVCSNCHRKLEYNKTHLQFPRKE